MTRGRWIIRVRIMFSFAAFLGMGSTSYAAENTAEFVQGGRHVQGTVEHITHDQLRINIGEVQPRFIPLKIAREKGFSKMKVGDVVELTLNEQNVLVDFHLGNAAGQTGGNDNHTILNGRIAEPVAGDPPTALIRTDEGKEVHLEIRPQARSKMASLPIATDAVFMLDDTNKIVDVNFASQEAAEQTGQGFEDKAPVTGSQQHIVGIVVKPLANNRITIRTDDGAEQRFEVQHSMRDRLATLPKGTMVVLMIDETNHVADVTVPPTP